MRKLLNCESVTWSQKKKWLSSLIDAIDQWVREVEHRWLD